MDVSTVCLFTQSCVIALPAEGGWLLGTFSGLLRGPAAHRCRW